MNSPFIYLEDIAEEEKPSLEDFRDFSQPYKSLLDFKTVNHKQMLVMAFNLYSRVQAHGSSVEWTVKGKTKMIDQSPHEFIKNLFSFKAKPIGQYPFLGGGIGYTGYSYSFQFENLSYPDDDPLDVPDVHLLFHSDYLVFHEHSCQHIHLEYDHPLVETMIKPVMKKARQCLYLTFGNKHNKYQLSAEYHSNMRKGQFKSGVSRIRENIMKGDIFQAVLSQRWTGTFNGSAFQYYLDMRKKHPDTYNFYLDFGTYQLTGCSPERLMAIEKDVIYSNPIAGTRPRGRTTLEDELLMNELKADEKERAEHLMLVDLARNDLGKICTKNSIKVRRLMDIEKFQNVMHLVSEVTGELEASIHPLDAIKACLPAGTVSGAPKMRAMELISEYEKEKRAVYGGGIGYISQSGDMDFALAIRTSLIMNGKIHLQSGAGIVYDSLPENEWKETLYKAGLKEGTGLDFINR